MDDFTIIDMFFQREESAIAAAKDKYGNRLLKISKNILDNDEDAEENVNDTLLKAWKAIPPTRPEILIAFLIKIARNLSLNKLEAKNTAKRGGGETKLLLLELEECISGLGNPEGEYEASLVTKAINTFLDNSDKTARVVFVLRYFHGESIRNISETLKMTESKVKSILFRTRKKLADHLIKEGVTI